MSLMLFALAFQASALPAATPTVAPVSKPKMICEEVEQMGSPSAAACASHPGLAPSLASAAGVEFA